MSIPNIWHISAIIRLSLPPLNNTATFFPLNLLKYVSKECFISAILPSFLGAYSGGFKRSGLNLVPFSNVFQSSVYPMVKYSAIDSVSMIMLPLPD